MTKLEAPDALKHSCMNAWLEIPAACDFLSQPVLFRFRAALTPKFLEFFFRIFGSFGWRQSCHNLPLFWFWGSIFRTVGHHTCWGCGHQPRSMTPSNFRGFWRYRFGAAGCVKRNWLVNHKNPGIGIGCKFYNVWTSFSLLVLCFWEWTLSRIYAACLGDTRKHINM